MGTLDLKRIRKDCQVTQLHMAELTGYPQGFISRIETGKAPAPSEFVSRLVSVLHIENIDDYIIPDEDEMRRSTAKEKKEKKEQERIDRLLAIIERQSKLIEKLETENDRLRKQQENRKT